MLRILKTVILGTNSRQKSFTRAPRQRRSTIQAVFLLVVTAGFFYGLFTIYNDKANSPHTSPISDYALTQGILDTWYPYPDGPNAADVYLRAFTAYKDTANTSGRHLIDYWAPPGPAEPLPHDTAELIQAYLDEHTEAIALLEAATEVEGCRFEAGATRHGDLFLTHHHQDLYDGVHLLYLAAVLETDQGRAGPACQRVAQITRIADVLYREPAVVSTLHSYRIRSIACNLTERLVTSGRLADEDLNMLGDSLKSHGSRVPDWYIALNISNSNTSALYRTAKTTEARTNAVRITLTTEQHRRAKASNAQTDQPHGL